MILALHGLTTRHSNLLTDIRIARETGYDAIEIVGSKLQRYLDNGFSLTSLLPLLKDLPAVGLDFVQDIERQEPEQYAALLDECERMCALAEQLGHPMVQLLTGPHEPNSRYRALEGMEWSQMRPLVAKNLAALGDIGKRHGIRFYLEALNFTPIYTLQQALELIDAAERDNIGLVVDFWHLWGSGATPEDIARLDKNLIFCAHFSDSLDYHGQRGDAYQRGRDVWTGAGRIPLKEWVDAVRATGFDGWWACELLSPKYWELDPWETARNLRIFFHYLFV